MNQRWLPEAGFHPDLSFNDFHSRIGLGDILGHFWNTQELLDREAQQMSTNPPAAFDPCQCDDTQTEVRVLMIAPKTHTLPPGNAPGRGNCCHITVDIARGIGDIVPNQRGFARDDENFWQNWTDPFGGRTRSVDLGNNPIGHTPNGIGQPFPFLAPVGTGRNRRLAPTGEQPFDAAQWVRDNMRPDQEGYTFVCHSQGCNILMMTLNQACARRDA